jgi:hypothetical protein
MIAVCHSRFYHRGMGFARYLVFFFALSAFAANVKLYLKDGDFHLVREYKVDADRVRYYSIERGDWEEVPLSLVDLKRTEEETKARQAKIDEEAKLLTAEDKAERERANEVAKVPQGPGVHLVVGDGIYTLKQAESEMHTSKGRTVLQVLSPIPMVPGKGTVEMKGEHSLNKVTNDRPEFYISLASEERFGIIRLKSEKGVRIVERLSFVPVTKEVVEEQQQVEIFRQQIDEGLYKIWPTKPLEPGEYAVMEYTDGKVNIQTWDFAYDPKAKQALDSPAPSKKP